MSTNNFEERLKIHAKDFAPVVPISPQDKLLWMDFTATNTELTDEIINDTNKFIQYINNKLKAADAKYGVGGYNEHRTIYRRSELFSPSPKTILVVEDGAKAPSRWEEDEESFGARAVDQTENTHAKTSTIEKGINDNMPLQEKKHSSIWNSGDQIKNYDLSSPTGGQGASLVQEDTTGYRHADPAVYGLLKEYALRHRATPTQTEDMMWEVLKTKQLDEYKFRRQHIIDRFIADFVCLKYKLIIEIDGLIHADPDNKISDEERTRRLNTLGFNVIRFTNDEVTNNIEGVLNKIREALRASDGPTPTTSTVAYDGAKAPSRWKEDEEPSNARAVDQTEINNSSIATVEEKGNDDMLLQEKKHSSISNERDKEKNYDLSSPTGGQGAVGQGASSPRNIHLGIDIWGKPYTKVMTPLDGIVHSFAFNNAYGDYGATIILTHNLDGESFHTLYGHLSLNSLKNLQEGDLVKKGDVIAEFGIPFENGQWPPHLHFQLIKDMQGMKGDYPGVCAIEERDIYLKNCPDPELILQIQ